ncbi:MAG: thioredoxin family protein [Deltaproteobacteria bacterium]|nr:thioredoxin family protein [Deltaproteobacteria bacterium]
MQEKISQINVAGHLTGVIGLDEAIREAVHAMGKDASEPDAAREIIRRIAQKNYIPEKLLPDYRAAVVREYKKYLGEDVPEEPAAGLRVVILGPGCYQCDSLERGVRDIMADMNLAGDLEHVTDVQEIARYGVMGVPALVINNKIVSTGVLPDKKKIREWLACAARNIK